MKSGRGNGKWRLFLAVALSAVLASGLVAAAPGPTSGETADAGAVRDDTLQQLRVRAARIRALLDGSLDPAIDPATLFDVPIADERSVAVEVQRLRRLLPTRPTNVDADASAGRPDGGEPIGQGAPADPDVWTARLELDRARLAFYELPTTERAALLERHAEKRVEPEQASAAVASAEREATEAARDRDRALEAARRAESEARRLVEEERARLLGIKAALSTFEGSLAEAESDLAQTSEPILGWRRRVDETIAERVAGRAGPRVADRMYTELLEDWQAKQSELASALGAIGEDAGVPEIGPDRLEKLGADVKHADVDALHQDLQARHDELERRVAQLRRERAELLLEHILQLNMDRLDLFPQLSAEMRDELTSFGTAGVAQAVAEIRQVSLVLRFHFLTTLRWLTDPDARKTAATSTFVAALTALKLVALIIPFVWWRRRADGYLSRAERRLADVRPTSEHAHRIDLASSGLRVLRRTRSVLEWLLFFQSATLLLPPRVHGLLEVQLLSTVVVWVLSGMLAVDLVDALAAESSHSAGRTDTAQLRFRSLSLISRLVVAFGLILALSDHLVGEGTVYTWVLTFCWFAALPLALVLIRWWRPVVLERLEMRRKKNRFTSWAERQQTGWRSFIAVFGGGLFLTGVRLGRLVRNYLTARELTRRALAYWFRREVGKQSLQPEDTLARRPLSEADRAVLDPERPAEQFIDAPMDEVTILTRPIDAPEGGVFAIVGERGAGKTATLRRLHGRETPSKLVSCPRAGTCDALLRAIAESTGLAPDVDVATLSEHINAANSDSALLIDEAQRLVVPVIGGFAEFDRVISFARRSGATCTWVFAFDSAIWQHLQRARGVRPLFDDVLVLDSWSEESIAALLLQRTAMAKLDVRFDTLVRNLPPDADEIDRAEALMKAQQNFYRVIWDYADGNPAVALELFRDSIYENDVGGKYVEIVPPPAPDALQSLPDSTLFVLRAVLQLEPSGVDAIVDATSLEPGDVADALRHSTFRGYVEPFDGCYRVSWKWFRAVTRLLERKHLITDLRRTS